MKDFPDGKRIEADRKVLVVTAVAAEREAVRRGLRESARFEVVAGGVGPASSAVAAAKALATGNYDVVVSAGIGGGFTQRAEVGSIVVGSEIVAADLGAETPEGFRSVDELGFGTSRLAADTGLARRVTEALADAGLPVHLGPILTLSTVTGTAETAYELAKRVPEAAAEAMEGYGVAAAAVDRSLPFLEIRTISNPVGPRDRSAWKIKEAMDALEAAANILLEVL